MNRSVDSPFSGKAGEAKNQAVTEKGINEVESAGRTARAGHDVATGGVSGGTTTGAGAHSGAVGNLHSDAAATSNLAHELGSRN
jgi:hypothetical protein